MEIIRAATAGFCMGVGLALQKLEEALTQAPGASSGRICTLGPIIHNPQVLADFESRGVVCLDTVLEVKLGDIVLIRAHGLPRHIESALNEKEAIIRDATCPKVKKAQLSIARATAHNETMLIFGEADHPEVCGLVSYAKGEAHIFEDEKSLPRLDLSAGARYVLASQTTQDRNVFTAIKEDLQKKLPNLLVLDTICDATNERQEEARQIASRVDAMIIVGGKQSGNTRRLALVAQNCGVPAWHVETFRQLDSSQFAGLRRIGLTAGASTPKCLIDETENWLRANFQPSVMENTDGTNQYSA